MATVRKRKWKTLESAAVRAAWVAYYSAIERGGGAAPPTWLIGEKLGKI